MTECLPSRYSTSACLTLGSVVPRAMGMGNEKSSRMAIKNEINILGVVAHTWNLSTLGAETEGWLQVNACLDCIVSYRPA